MFTTPCVCGAELAGDTRDEQVAAALAHFQAAHAELQLTQTQLRNFLERFDQLAPPGARLADVDPERIDVVELTPDRVDDVLGFFDRDAFADNPGWAACYCQAHHVEGGERSADWAGRTWQHNRAELAARIEAGTTKGCLAYAGGKVVGWCNASPRSTFPEYTCGEHDDRVGVTACFVIAPAYRGHGIATRLLDQACAQFARDGMETAEGHPATDPESEAGAYRGPLDMYRAAGFQPVDAGDPSCDGARTTVVRRPLT